MANTKKNSSNRTSNKSKSSTTRKTSTTSTKKTASKAVATTTNTNTYSEPSNFQIFWAYFKESKAFIPSILVLVSLIGIGIDFLCTLNDYTKFFKVLGIEIIIIGFIWVLILAINTLNSDTNSKQIKDIQ